MAAPRFPGFERATLAFLKELARNNNREWFQANKSRYETSVLDVALRFIQAMQEPMAEIAPHFVVQATRVGGSLMRVYRDTRFSNAKTPYKTMSKNGGPFGCISSTTYQKCGHTSSKFSVHCFSTCNSFELLLFLDI
jgi:uncharacterized protein (DUF2461 family)